MKRRVPTATLKITLPRTLHAAFTSAIQNTDTGRAQYGAASHIIEALIREWMHREGLPQDA